VDGGSGRAGACIVTTRIQFWGGLGVIGSSKLTITHGGHRVMLDVGLDIPGEADLFRPPVRERAGRELADRLRLGLAPRVPGLWDPRWLHGVPDPDGQLAGPDADTAVFASHAHIDHIGLAGFVRTDIPLYAHADTIAILAALAVSGQGLAGREPDWRPLTGGQVVQHGSLSVECIPVDHDLPGACGYLVTTPDGSIAFTGDLRFHGRHPHLSRAFVDRIHGVDVLVTEGTLLSFDPYEGPMRTETDVRTDFLAALRHPGLVLLSIYPRDLERVREFTQAAHEVGRALLWPPKVAVMLRELGIPAASWGEPGALAAVSDRPAEFVVQPDMSDLPSLLDLPVRPGTPLFHANGEPLGEFDPKWSPFADWIEALGLDLWRAGSSGHASADAVFSMLEQAAPGVVFPIHTMAPTRCVVPSGTCRVIPHYDRVYELADRTVTVESAAAGT